MVPSGDWAINSYVADDLFISVCPIFIGNDGYLDTSDHEPEPKFITALRVLEVGLHDWLILRDN
jgi:hypothetical protein